jgi:hypothetical protein
MKLLLCKRDNGSYKKRLYVTFSQLAVLPSTQRKHNIQQEGIILEAVTNPHQTLNLPVI